MDLRQLSRGINRLGINWSNYYYFQRLRVMGKSRTLNSKEMLLVTKHTIILIGAD